MAAKKPNSTTVYIEVGKKKVFAMALDWPGWGRSGKTADDALAALAEYAERYAPVVRAAKIDFPAEAGENFSVVEEVDGSATTDFGAPASLVESDSKRLTAKEAGRAATLQQACWDTLDTMAGRSPAELRKGPRGGGRDRDKMLDHVLGAEAAYARKIGIKHQQPAVDDVGAIKAMRSDIIEVLSAGSGGGSPVPKGWPVRYAVRRFAWHALDHAWEMQDRDPDG